MATLNLHPVGPGYTSGYSVWGRYPWRGFEGLASELPLLAAGKITNTQNNTDLREHTTSNNTKNIKKKTNCKPTASGGSQHTTLIGMMVGEKVKCNYPIVVPLTVIKKLCSKVRV